MTRFDDIYDQLKLIARREIGRHQASTLNTTALVHEAFVKLAQHDAELDRAHRINLVARVMRQITVDHARAKQSAKRSGKIVDADWLQTLTPTHEAVACNQGAFDLVAFDQALQTLATQHPRMARVLELAFFAGVGNEDIAELMQLNARTVQRDLLAARTLLMHQLGGEEGNTI
jgi:RNA polymerase sigma factor (TIGR02999 family)